MKTKGKEPVAEARRYVDNAKEVLKERGQFNEETLRYDDNKYVKAAGHYLWHSVLIMLDAVFKVKTKSHPHPDIKSYYEAVNQRDKKLLAFVSDGYKTLHIAMGYDGNPRKAVCDDGFQLANEIIERCKTMITSDRF